MKKVFFVDLFKAGVSVLTSVFSLAMLVCMLYLDRPVSALVFAAVALLFFFPACRYSSRIAVTEEGIRRTLLGKTTAFWRWEEIAEVGVIGTNVLSKAQKKTGTLYIYISRQKMTEESRFDMILKWPPKEQLFLLYTREGLDAIQLHFSSRIETSNTGTLRL